MNVFNQFDKVVKGIIEEIVEAGALPAGLDLSRVKVEPPRDPDHGDLATNAAMVIAKAAGRKPRDLAELLARGLEGHQDIEGIAIAGPGFINIRLKNAFWTARVGEILAAGTAYGNVELGAGRAVNVEYVSANPTGPMHVGHGRGAVVGDALASLLEKAGYDVTREYYINDAGAQIDTLARSAYLRYREARGEDIGAIPDGLYPGDYLKPVGAEIADADGDKWMGVPEKEWLERFRTLAVERMMALIGEDLQALGVAHDCFTSERALSEAGAIEAVIESLKKRDLVYTGTLEPPRGRRPDDWEDRPQLLFRATAFGDDSDRPLRKSDGEWTYFASDIAYHLDKYRRGFATMIDVWGADHKGYVKRMKAAVEAVSDGDARLDVRLCNLVNLLEDGEPVKMSKRSGSFVSLREVIDAVGKDVVRFMMLTRNNDALLDFDLGKVLEQSKDNPVFYVQYAHARICSVLRRVTEEFPELDLDDSSLEQADFDLLNDPGELAMIKRLTAWPRTVESAAISFEPHRVAYYLTDLAGEFHAFWNKGNTEEKLRFIIAGDEDLTRARVALARAVAVVIASGLAVMGVEPVEEMR